MSFSPALHTTAYVLYTLICSVVHQENYVDFEELTI